MMRFAALQQRGYLSPQCRCTTRMTFHRRLGANEYEVEWNPKCPIHKDDVIGANYKPPNR